MLKELFERCLHADYIHTAEDGDYAIEIDGDTLYILFECSDGKADWINNFDFLPDACKDAEETPKRTFFRAIIDAICTYFKLPSAAYKDMFSKWRVHGGFLKVWKAMRDEIENEVMRELTNHPEIKKITCVGYSHGAAISVLATEDMEYLYGDKYAISGYGFGTPRVLWGIIPEEVKYRLRNFTSVRNINDIVTHVPPMFLGFRNAGTLVKIGAKKKYNMIDAHRPESYLQELVM